MRGIPGGYEDLERLVDRCRQGDDRAWGTLVDRFQALVYSIPRRYGLQEDDAADVFQATFQTLLQNLDRIESARALPRWLAVTASRESLRIKRISGRAESGGDLPLDEILSSEEKSAEAGAIEADLAFRLRQGLSEMQEKCRSLLSMLYFEDGVSYETISDKLSMPIGAIGPTRARCLEKLRKILGGKGFFE
ncbi:MAG TPA: sigma-70 family RNA polymerase sigma factor [Fimbriimonas sp.]